MPSDKPYESSGVQVCLKRRGTNALLVWNQRIGCAAAERVLSEAGWVGTRHGDAGTDWSIHGRVPGGSQGGARGFETPRHYGRSA